MLDLSEIASWRQPETNLRKLMQHLGKTQPDHEPLALTTILECNGLNYALQCFCILPKALNVRRLYAVWEASLVKHLMRDERSRNALIVAQRYANGNATDNELRAAWTAAKVAAGDTAWARTKALFMGAAVPKTSAEAADEAAASAARAAVRASTWNSQEPLPWTTARAVGWAAHCAAPLGDNDADAAIKAALTTMLKRVFECETMGQAVQLLNAEIDKESMK
jgi:hypothetical protein